MLGNNIYYYIRPLIPRRLQILLRSSIVRRKRASCSDVWPIDESAGGVPEGFTGWPGDKRFALVLTHDVETARGQDKCRDLVRLEKAAGFKSSFNFVPERYSVSPDLRAHLSDNGFEVGVHGLYHDGKLFKSKKIFDERAKKINGYLEAWRSVGFCSPSMHSDLEWVHALDIEYDISTFDIDPFEPYPSGAGTIFPSWRYDASAKSGYVELPYTLAQDFTVFVLMREKTIELWKRKLDWIVERGGMALLISHPDYMNFGPGRSSAEEYHNSMYQEILDYVKKRYAGQYWNPLPKEMARFWKENMAEVSSEDAGTSNELRRRCNDTGMIAMPGPGGPFTHGWTR